MGYSSTIFGFIEIHADHIDEVVEEIESFEFDSTHPFRNCFSKPSKGYRGWIISFSDSVKMHEPEWSQWIERFESLLKKLNGLRARVEIEDDDGKGQIRLAYVNSDDNWVIFELPNGTDSGEEIERGKMPIRA